MPPRCSVLLSGGVDSALVVSLLRYSGWITECIWVDYHQPAAEAERIASRAVAGHYRVAWREVALRGMEVPNEGEILGRNDMLIAAALACAPGATVAVGVHAGTEYADCSVDWLEAWQALLDVQHSGRVSILAPLIDLSKAQVFELARNCAVPLEVTYSCEKGLEPCGRCQSCLDRQLADVGT